MLVLWDRGFHDCDLVAMTHATDAKIVARLPNYVKLPPVRPCGGGTLGANLRLMDKVPR